MATSAGNMEVICLTNAALGIYVNRLWKTTKSTRYLAEAKDRIKAAIITRFEISGISRKLFKPKCEVYILRLHFTNKRVEAEIPVSVP
jgi:hypothetical protein